MQVDKSKCKQIPKHTRNCHEKWPYPGKFKIEADKHMTDRGHQVADVSTGIGASQQSLYKWIKVYAAGISLMDTRSLGAQRLMTLGVATSITLGLLLLSKAASLG